MFNVYTGVMYCLGVLHQHGAVSKVLSSSRHLVHHHTVHIDSVVEE